MAYTPTNWQTGDVVTAERLNKLENGVTSAQVYTESETVRFSGEVTALAQGGVNSAEIDCNLLDAPEQITVVFDGTEYTVDKVVGDDGAVYGIIENDMPSFSQYPFCIYADTATPRAMLVTETASTHQVVIKTVTRTINSELQAALPFRAVVGTTTLAELEEAWGSGRLVYYIKDGGTIYFLLSHINSEIVTYPDVSEFIIDEDGVLQTNMA